MGVWVTWVIWYFAEKLCTRCDAWAGMLLWWSCQSPVAHRFSLLNHLHSVHGGMVKLKAKFDADSLLYSLSNFECDDHAVHMLIQGHLPPPLTSTVKSSLFTHAHASPLSLAARLHRCWTNCSHYINNSWTFFWTDLIFLCVHPSTLLCHFGVKKYICWKRLLKIKFQWWDFLLDSNLVTKYSKVKWNGINIPIQIAF